VPRRTAHPLQALLFTLLLVVLLTNVLTTSFERLGLSPHAVTLVVAGSLLGSFVNIPLRVRRLRPGAELVAVSAGYVVFRRTPETPLQILAVNLGGAIVPLLISAWLLPHAPLWKIGLATVVVALVAHRLARIVPGSGIEMPAFVPPLAAGAVAWLIAGSGGPEAAPIAYVSGTMGTLIGADLMNLQRLIGPDGEPGILSIGGAGVFDGVFMVGIAAAFLV
jgi:uncharacterized membrane protein